MKFGRNSTTEKSDIFALILDILHIHAHEYSSYSFEQKLLSLTRAVLRSGEKEHAGCADIRARK
jgi:hypothetical protein